MYYIMRKSYYVMHKLLRYAKHVLRYAVIITLCGNYYVMRRHNRAFAVSVPRLWNALPCELQIAISLISFKRLLKTHLFRMAYEQ